MMPHDRRAGLQASGERLLVSKSPGAAPAPAVPTMLDDATAIYPLPSQLPTYMVSAAVYAASWSSQVDHVKQLFVEMPQDPMSPGGDVEMSVTDHDPLASWDQHVTRSARSTNEASLELEAYLKKVSIRRSDQFNILAWWQMNSAEYPTVSRMARDILVVPASTIASESAFSTGSRIISDFRSRLTLATVVALVCLQDWIRATDEHILVLSGTSNRFMTSFSHWKMRKRVSLKGANHFWSM